MHSTENYAINRRQSSIKDGSKITHVPPFPRAGSRLIRVLCWLPDADSIKVFWLSKLKVNLLVFQACRLKMIGRLKRNEAAYHKPL